jgi:hypothetical protein
MIVETGKRSHLEQCDTGEASDGVQHAVCKNRVPGRHPPPESQISCCMRSRSCRDILVAADVGVESTVARSLAR